MMMPRFVKDSRCWTAAYGDAGTARCLFRPTSDNSELQKSPVFLQIRGGLSEVRHSGEVAGYCEEDFLPGSGGTDRISLQTARVTALSHGSPMPNGVVRTVPGGEFPSSSHASRLAAWSAASTRSPSPYGVVRHVQQNWASISDLHSDSLPEFADANLLWFHSFD